MIPATIIIPIEGQPAAKVLLGHKLRGFGQGKVVGFGGKIDEGESPVASAMREFAEETGLTASPGSLDPAGIIAFYFPFKPEWNTTMHVFRVTGWEGEPKPCDEVTPEWFPVSKIPFDLMWDDARYWLLLVISGARISARFTFGMDNNTVAYYTISSTS